MGRILDICRVRIEVLQIDWVKERRQQGLCSLDLNNVKNELAIFGAGEDYVKNIFGG